MINITPYLEPSDYLIYISEDTLRKMLRSDNYKLTEAEGNAVSHLDRLREKFNIEAELIRTGDNRNRILVRWLASLSVYYLYQCVPDDEIPERVIKNFNDAVDEIGRVASGRDACTLERKTDSTGRAKTSFVYSSNKRRTHNPFE